MRWVGVLMVGSALGGAACDATTTRESGSESSDASVEERARVDAGPPKQETALDGPYTRITGACVRGRAEGGSQVLEAGEPIEVRGAVAIGCVSSSSTRVEEASCAVSVNDRGALSMTAEVYLRFRGHVASTADCLGGGSTAVRCRSEPLEAGSYTLIGGRRPISFTVPGTLSTRELCGLPKEPLPPPKPKLYIPKGL